MCVGGGGGGGGDTGIVPHECLRKTEDMKVTGKIAGWLPSR